MAQSFNHDGTKPGVMPVAHDLRQFLVGVIGGILFGVACLAAALAPAHQSAGLQLCRVEGPKLL